MSQVISCRASDSRYPAISDQMFSLRYRAFHERLKWDVKPTEGRETDRFDNGHAVYLVSMSEEQQVIGSWRLIPTTEPYMLSDVFPELLHGAPIPRSADTWELSRFAFDRGAGEGRSYGFGETTMQLLAETCRFLIANDIRRLVLVVSTRIERLLRSAGLRLNRFGPSITIGSVPTVACSLAVDQHMIDALLGTEAVAQIGVAA